MLLAPLLRARQRGLDDGAFALQFGAGGVLGEFGQVGEFVLGFFLQPLGMLGGGALAAQGCKFVALACLAGLPGAPRIPAGARAAGVFQGDAIDRAGGHAQGAAGALLLDHGVHAFVRADDAIDRAGLDAQGAADAPGFVDPGHLPRLFNAALGIERPRRLAGERGQAAHPFGPAGRALIDGRLPVRHRLRVSGAVGKAAAGALGLGQGVKYAPGQLKVER